MNKQIEEIIKASNSVAVFFHINPDGDAIGSSLALKLALNQLNKQVDIYSCDFDPKEIEFLDGKNIITKITNKKYDLAIVLDCPDIKRIGTMFSVYKNCTNVVNIDHHLFNQNFTKYKLVDTTKSSTCELIYDLIKQLNLEITKDIARCLYTGLATDSGCFMYNISKNLHKIAGELVAKFDDVDNINFLLFREKRKEEVSLYAEAINKLEYHVNDRLAITNITLKDLEKHNAKQTDTIGLVFLLSGLKDVDVVCVVCEEKEGQYKVAFRSKSTNVCAIAQLFGGGGHKLASGCKIYGSKNSVKKKIIAKVQEYLCTV